MDKKSKVITKEEELVCVDLNHEGVGVVKSEGIPYFVANLLPTEKAKVLITRKENAKFGSGEVVKLLSESKDRVKPLCPNFGLCGGCDLLHLNYQSELNFKLKMVNETFSRLGHLDFRFKEIIGAKTQYSYRNKVQIPFKMKKGRVSYGFFQKKSHEIIEFDNCLLESEKASEIARLTKNLLNELKIEAYDEIEDKGIFRHLLIRKTYNNKYMVVFIVNKKDKSFDLEKFKVISDRISNKYKEVESIIINYNNNKNNIILGEEYDVLNGADYLVEEILGLKFRMSHKAFFQVNHEQTEVLYQRALEFASISKDDKVLDCYCGVGTISLLASRYAKEVVGIEIIPEAIDNANMNKELNGISNARFIVGKAEEKINEIDDIDVLIVDPPRKGLDKSLIDTIINKKIKRVVYVSCDPATLARDLSILSEYYSIEKGVLVDLFPRTCHVECISSLVLRNISS